ncbi:MAG: hypothetical protein CMF31_00700 [Kordiimonas sp.]|nr:hypothetical protein [Kordiimonas sp.]|tara:strand:+ start:1443 stop:1778 length:336 start_codon:yes stop_codon:yes gene_type:complete
MAKLQAPPVPTRVNRMVNDLTKNRNSARELLQEGGFPALFKKYELSDAEIAAFDKAAEGGLGKIGVPPMYQMGLLSMMNPDAHNFLNVSCFLERHAVEVKQSATPVSRQGE